MKRIVVVAPHADDAELGAGGYIARSTEAGDKVLIVLVTASTVRMEAAGVVPTVVRLEEQAKAAERLGATMTFLDVGVENEMQNASMEALVSGIDRVCDDFRADELLIPLPSYNQDHRVVHDACIASGRPVRTRLVPTVMAYEIPMNCWGPARPTNGLRYVELTQLQLGRKMAALADHRSQFLARKNPMMSADSLRQLAHLRGLECGVEFAELFYVLREIVR